MLNDCCDYPSPRLSLIRKHPASVSHGRGRWSAAAELLFALEEPALAEQVIIERSRELDGRNYVMLTGLVKKAKADGRLLAATLIWRALIDAILARGYTKAYGHAARYLAELRAASGSIEDYRGHASHESYERDLRLAHGRKASFWGRLPSSASGPEVPFSK